ncbi:MAG: alpha/beta fold hydrolase [Actinomycetota bacterium]
MTPTLKRFANDGLVFDLYVDGPDDGEPVVLLHGFPQNSSSFGRVVEALVEAGYRAFRYDQRGYSPGARPTGARHYAIRRVLGDLVALAERFVLVPFHLVGHDWGGVVGWHAAGRHPQMLRTYTSLSMPHPSAYLRALRTRSQFRSALYAAFFQLPYFPERKLGQSDFERLRRGLMSTGLPEEFAARYTARMTEPGALTAALNWYRAAGRGLHRLGAPPSRVPTLYVWGSADPALARAAADATESYVAAPYRFEVLEGAGHWLPETNADDIARSILEHLGR